MRRRAAAPEPPSDAGAGWVYAVGDVHGRLDLLRAMVEAVQADLAAHSQTPAASSLVFLGDYIDRGPDSRGVIDLLLRLQQAGGVRLTCLRGNHEHALLAFLNDPRAGRAWLSYGGWRTLAAYGVEPSHAEAADLEGLRERLLAAMPAAHVDFLRRLPLSATRGDYMFVHAGVRPGTPLDAQDPGDLLMIRGPFLDARRPSPKVIVHGHTPASEPYMDRRRIGLDTGAYATGVLSAVRLAGPERQLLQVRASPAIASA